MQTANSLKEFFDSLPKAKRFISKAVIRGILSKRAEKRYKDRLLKYKHNYPVAN